jgi:NADPH:quinone reductase-like Zn-dependent oxidoreductase
MRCYEIVPGKTGTDALRQAERPDAKPSAGEVAVRVRAASINARDFSILMGRYRSGPVTRPTIPLSDGAGEVVEIGAGVTRFKPGDKVAGIFCQTWIDGAFTPDMFAGTLGSPVDGMLADRAVLSQAGLVRVPSHLSFEEAATLPCAAVTAWNALVARGGLTAGQWVLALGTGGVSVFALQLAKAAGARVIITSSSDDKLARAKSLGADRTINYKSTPDWDKAVLDATGGGGVDHVVEVGGAGTLPRSLAAIRTGGQIHQIGFLAGRETPIDLSAIVGKRAIINGTFTGSRAMFEAMNAAIEASGLMPVVDKVFPFEQAVAAFGYQQSAGLFGKVVIAT